MRSTLVAATASAVLSLSACSRSAVDSTATGAATDELRACFAEDDPPRSRRGVGGFDIDTANFLAQRLDRRLLIVWLPEAAQTDIESTDADYRPLAMGQCDLQMSVPGAEAVKRYRGWLVLSEPYYGAGFELIPADSPFRFGTTFAGTVAVRANTVAHLALNAADTRWSQQSSSAEIVAAVAEGASAAGLVWGPDLALLDSDHNPDFDAPPVLRWNLHAALRRDSPLLDDVNRVFASAEFGEQVAARLAQYGIPARGPFDNVHTPSLLTDL
ncbi:MAG: hypothetical protein OXL38_06180 [Gammaproteobacteria bacterium]|nr:hypothetical protein [Gammaproteobacteria bacterium]